METNDPIDDEALRQLGWVDRLYTLTEPRRFAEHALLVLLDAAEAPAGYVVFRTDAGAAVGGALRGHRPRRIQARLATAAVADAVAARLAEPAPVLLHHEGPLAGLASPIGAPHLASVRLEHGEADCASLWVLARQTPFGSVVHGRLAALVRAVTYAGDLMLPRLPGGPSGFYTRVRLGPGPETRALPAAVVELLDGLSALAADCACLAARGYTNRQISAYLRIGEGAVARHLSAVYRHLAIDGRHQLDVKTLLSLPKPAPRLHRNRRGRRPASERARRHRGGPAIGSAAGE